MVGCSIRNCKNRAIKGGPVRFFTFPKIESVANQWLLYCGSKTTTKHARICSEHFTPSDFIIPLRYRLQPELKMPLRVRSLKPDAVPTLKIDVIDNTKSKMLKDNVTIIRKTTTGSPDNDTCKDSKLGSESDNTSSNECPDKVQVLVVLDAENSESMDYANTEKIAGETEKKNMYIVNIDHLRKTTNEISKNIENSDDGEIELDDNSDRTSHTTEADIISSPSKNIEIRNNKVMIPLSEYELLKEKYNEYHILMHNLEQIFTPGQIRSLADPYRPRVQWSEDDITAAIALRRISAASYRYLRTTVGIPLPGFSTLRRWAIKHGVDISEHVTES